MQRSKEHGRSERLAAGQTSHHKMSHEFTQSSFTAHPRGDKMGHAELKRPSSSIKPSTAERTLRPSTPRQGRTEATQSHLVQNHGQNRRDQRTCLHTHHHHYWLQPPNISLGLSPERAVSDRPAATSPLTRGSPTGRIELQLANCTLIEEQLGQIPHRPIHEFRAESKLTGRERAASRTTSRHYIPEAGSSHNARGEGTLARQTSTAVRSHLAGTKGQLVAQVNVYTGPNINSYEPMDAIERRTDDTRTGPQQSTKPSRTSNTDGGREPLGSSRARRQRRHRKSFR